MARGRSALLIALCVISLAACTKSVPAVLEIEGNFDKRAVEICTTLFGGVAQSDLVGAVDSTLTEVIDIADSAGYDSSSDPNFAVNSGDTYSALCIISGDIPEASGVSRLLLYQVGSGSGGAAIFAY